MSPTAGPPITRTISAVDPPSSETGSTCVTCEVSWRSAPAQQKMCAQTGRWAVLARKLDDSWVVSLAVAHLRSCNCRKAGIPSQERFRECNGGGGADVDDHCRDHRCKLGGRTHSLGRCTHGRSVCSHRLRLSGGRAGSQATAGSRVLS